MRRPWRRDRARPTVDITPMIDVVFLLIIFFMTTAQFARLTRAEVDLPQEKGEQRTHPDEAGIVINITAEGGIIVGDRTIDPSQLESVVREQIGREDGGARQTKLLIRADRNAPAKYLNSVADLLESLGVGSARLATEVPR